MIQTHASRAMIALLAALCFVPAARAQDSQTKNIYFQYAYVREEVDAAWQFRLTGNVPSLPGAYLFMHDADGKLLLKRHIPYGRKTGDQPLVIDMPADGRTGDYRIVIVGYQQDTLELDLPLTTLPREVYGRTHFASRTSFPFRVPEGVTQLTLSAYMTGSLRVLENGTPVFDVKEKGEAKGRNLVAVMPVKAGVDYELQPYATFYFGVEEGIFFSTNLVRWFHPDVKLHEVKWWQQSGS